MSMHCGVRFGRSSCMATNRVECIKSCGHKSNHSRKLAAKQQKDTPFQIQEGGIWPGIMHSITTYNLFPLNRSSFKIHYVSSLFVLSRSYIILKSESLCNQLGDYKPPKFKHKVRFLRLLPGDYSQFYEWG